MAWQPVGICVGVYDMCARYLKQREQFGTPIGAFQLMQEKLQRMLGNIQVGRQAGWWGGRGTWRKHRGGGGAQRPGQGWQS